MKFSEETKSSELIYKGRVFTVKKDAVKLPDQRTAEREVVLHNGGVGVICVDEENNIILVRQYRYGAATETLEIPAGKLEAGEDALCCAKRELSEETGYIAKEFMPLGFILPTPAYCSEKIYIFLASGLTRSEQKLDDDEFLEVITMNLDEAFDKVMKNEINDAKTVAAILKVKALQQNR